MTNFEIEKDPPDVQEMYRQMYEGSRYGVRQGQKFINSFGRKFLVIKNSTFGDSHVWVEEKVKFGKTKRFIPKYLLFV